MPDSNVDISQVLPILKQIPLFSTLDENIHKEIIHRIILMFYPEKHQLFSKGDSGDALYLIRKGQVEIFSPPKEEGDLERTIATLTPGDFFGEMALISEENRNASARTLTETEVFVLSKSDFQLLLNSNPLLAQQISETMVDRLNENDRNTLL